MEAVAGWVVRLDAHAAEFGDSGTQVILRVRQDDTIEVAHRNRGVETHDFTTNSAQAVNSVALTAVPRAYPKWRRYIFDLPSSVNMSQSGEGVRLTWGDAQWAQFPKDDVLAPCRLGQLVAFSFEEVYAAHCSDDGAPVFATRERYRELLNEAGARPLPIYTFEDFEKYTKGRHE